MRFLSRFFAPAISLLLLSCTGGEKVIQMPSLDGIGLSGQYAGQIGERLFVAGGCNFPDKPLTEGGRKAFHDEIWALGDKGWDLMGTLPEPSAYGAYLCSGDGILIMGGANANGSLDKVLLLSAENGVEELDPLPKPLEQAAWYDDGKSIFLAGGLSNGEASLDILEYGDGNWSVIGTLPRPIVQGVATMSGDTLFIWGGFDPSANEAVTGACALNLKTGEWSFRETDITFVGAAPLDGYAIGGCDPEIFTNALGLSGEELHDYRIQAPEYYRFRGELLQFKDGGWTRVASSPHLARAGAAAAFWQGGIVSVGGELKPGVRTPEVWMITLNNK